MLLKCKKSCLILPKSDKDDAVFGFFHHLEVSVFVGEQHKEMVWKGI